jgi:peptidoglycan/xylan/chitin deacetylase (PgdA/CDA1 family)
VGLHLTAAAAGLVVPSAWPWLLGVVAANHAVLGIAGMLPQAALLGPNLHRLPTTGRPEVALSFDDGPDPEITPRVLDLLDRHGAQASFFCIGAAARARPGLVREIAARGHTVGNHTDLHPHHFAAMAPAAMSRQIDAAQATLTTLIGSPPRFFRAPMGLRNPLLQPLLAARGLTLVSWTRRALDGVPGDPRAAAGRLCAGGPRAGDVLLLHDGHAGRGPDGRAIVLSVLPDLLAELAARGLYSITLDQALAGGRVGTAMPA